MNANATISTSKGGRGFRLPAVRRAGAWIGAWVLVLAVTVPVNYVAAQSELQKEIRRREGLLNEASALIHEGDLLRRQSMLVQSLGAYQAAYDTLPNAPSTAILRTTARDKYTEVANELTRELAREGRFEEARRVLKTVREPVFNPDNEEAKVIEKELDDPVIYPPAMSPGHAMDVDEVVDNLKMANSYMSLGDFDRAENLFYAVLRVDRYNSAARRGLERVEQYRVNYLKSARDHTREKMLVEITKEWETEVPLLDSDLESVRIGGRGGPASGISTGADSIAIKLKTIIIPNVQLSNTPITEVLEFLNFRSRDFDTTETVDEKKGINFVLSNQLDPLGKTVNITVSQIPIGELLRYACQQVGARFVIEEFAVRIVPQTFNSTALIDRSYVLPPGFLENVPLDPGAGGGAGPIDPFAPDGGRNLELEIRRLTAKELLERRGVTFPPDSLALYNKNTSVLTVRNTQRNIDLIELFVEDARSTQPRLVKVSVTVMQVSQIRLKELGFDWLLGAFNLSGSERVFGSGGVSGNTGADLTGDTLSFINPNSGSPIGLNPLTAGLRSSGGISGGGNVSIDSLLQTGVTNAGTGSRSPGQLAISGVFTDPEFQTVIRALDQKTGVDFTSTPSVVVKGGNRATINLIREFPYPTEFEPPQVPQQVNNLGALIPIVPGTPTAFTVRDVGTLLEVEPVIAEDNRRVDLNLVPEISFFEGFINYGNPINYVNPFAVPIPGVRGTIISPQPNNYFQPVFQTNKVSTAISVYDGQTIVMAGNVTHRVVSIEDKVPGLGDLPLLGRLFQSKVEQEERMNIVFFVRVDILDPGGRPFNEVRPGATRR